MCNGCPTGGPGVTGPKGENGIRPLKPYKQTLENKLKRVGRLDAKFNVIGAMSGRFITRPEPETLEVIVARLKAHPEQEFQAPRALRDALIRYPRPVVANNGEEYWIAVENSGATGNGSPPITHSPVRMRPWPMGPYGPWPVGGCGMTGATG